MLKDLFYYCQKTYQFDIIQCRLLSQRRNFQNPFSVYMSKQTPFQKWSWNRSFRLHCRSTIEVYGMRTHQRTMCSQRVHDHETFVHRHGCKPDLMFTCIVHLSEICTFLDKVDYILDYFLHTQQIGSLILLCLVDLERLVDRRLSHTCSAKYTD